MVHVDIVFQSWERPAQSSSKSAFIDGPIGLKMQKSDRKMHFFAKAAYLFNIGDNLVRVP